MILLYNKPLDIDEMMSEYPEGSIERLVLWQMYEGKGKYRYESLDQLRFELLLRREIVQASRDLNKSKFAFAVFHKSRANDKYWDRTENGGFKLKEGVQPSDAIRDIFVSGRQYATECATAMVIVYYKALLEVFGESLFNTLFPEIYLMDWYLRDPLLKEVGIPRQVSDILIGDRGYFANPDVSPKTPELQGENVIVLPKDLFYGHGIGITTADNIINALNANRKRDATRSAYFMEEVSRPDFKRLAEVYNRNRMVLEAIS